jgi:hypothetical protein
MAVRWVCPSCGKGANGPERPRLNATVRFCLGCSASSSTLVERVAPALERRRAERQASTTARQRAKRERERARERALFDLGGLDLREEVWRFWHLPAMRAGDGWWPSGPVVVAGKGDPSANGQLVIRRRSSASSSGHAWRDYGYATVTLGTNRAEALEVVLHELVHLAVGPDVRGHGAEFHQLLMAAARQAWPSMRFGFDQVRPGGDAYLPDGVIVVALRTQLEWPADSPDV